MDETGVLRATKTIRQDSHAEKGDPWVSAQIGPAPEGIKDQDAVMSIHLLTNTPVSAVPTLMAHVIAHEYEIKAKGTSPSAFIFASLAATVGMALDDPSLGETFAFTETDEKALNALGKALTESALLSFMSTQLSTPTKN